VNRIGIEDRRSSEPARKPFDFRFAGKESQDPQIGHPRLHHDIVGTEFPFCEPLIKREALMMGRPKSSRRRILPNGKPVAQSNLIGHQRTIPDAACFATHGSVVNGIERKNRLGKYSHLSADVG